MAVHVPPRVEHRWSMVLYMVGENFIEGARGAEELESRLWSMLQPEVLERVLLWLPLPAQARLRAVSKSWNLLFSSAKFLQQSASLTLVGRAPTCALQLYRDSWWRETCFRSLKAHSVEADFLPALYLTGAPWHMHAESGLVIFWGAEAEGLLCAVNPVNKTWKELPLLGATIDPEGRITIVADKAASSSFQVSYLWLDSSPKLMLSVYSSASDAWSTVSVVFPFVPSGTVPHVLHNGIVYVLSWSAQAKTYELWLADAGDGRSITRLQGPDPRPGSWTDSQPSLGQFLSQHNGRVLWSSQRSKCSVRIWMMEISSQTWWEVSVLPFDRFFPSDARLRLCKVQVADDMLFLRLVAKQPGSGNYYGHIVAYHLLQDSWHSIWCTSLREDGHGIQIYECRPTLHL